MPPLAYELLDRQVPGGLAAYVAERRDGERPKSWDAIAFELSTDLAIRIPGETLRRWMTDAEQAAS